MIKRQLFLMIINKLTLQPHTKVGLYSLTSANIVDRLILSYYLIFLVLYEYMFDLIESVKVQELTNLRKVSNCWAIM